jgi:diguanylate cyclase (GGDEF)-like protein/PAS domain S-box-containing protein
MSRILVVDDRDANRDFLVTLLRYRSHELLQARDGLEALDRVRTERPDLIICDILMPRMDGFEFVRQLRADPAVAASKVIFFSASYLEEDAQQLARAGGVIDVLSKPCPPEQILTTVDRALAADSTSTAAAPDPGFEQEHLRLITNKLSRKDDEQRESERRFRALLADVQLVSLMLDTEGRITDCNEYFLRLTGWTRDEVIGLDWFARFVPKDEVGARAMFLKLLAESPDARHHEHHIATRNNERRLIRWNHTLLRASGGRTVGTASIGEDITRQKRAEEEVAETRNFLASIFDNIPNVIFVKEAETLRYVRVNAAYEKVLGFSERELLGKSNHDLYPKEQADWFVAMDREVLAQRGQVHTVEEEITRKDGQTRIMLTRKLPIYGASGRPQFLLGMAEDITERKAAERRLLQSEAQYRQLIEQASDGIFISDQDGNYLIVNTSGCRMLGYQPGELIGQSGKVTYLDDEHELHSDRMKSLSRGSELRFERMVKRRDGTAFPAEVSVKMLDSGLVQAIFHDITTRREQERRIARLSRIHAMLSGINSAIVRIRDRQTLFDEACRIATQHGGLRIAGLGMVRPGQDGVAAMAWSGIDAAFLGGAARAWSKVLKPAPQGVVGRALSTGKTVIDADIAANPNIDQIRHAAVLRGCRSVIGLPLFENDLIAGVLVLYSEDAGFFDAEEVKLLEELAADVSFALTFIAQQEQVEYLAYYDTLTGLPNRSLFFNRLAQQLKSAHRTGHSVAVVLIDINRFRLVNDSLGRQAGDALLAAVSKRMQAELRDEDSLARVGSNRFALAISGTWSPSEGGHLLESRSRAVFERTFTIAGEDLRVSVSVGVAVYPADATEPETLFANAEAALRAAKADNSAFQFYGPEMNARVAEALKLENRIKHALENDEFVLWYQPKIDLKTGKVRGLEALMRWNDPEIGVVPPGRFIPLMEQTGLIAAAGRWAMTKVARDCRAWAAAGMTRTRIAINVSPLQVRQKDFVSVVVDAASALEEAGFGLDIEITESVIMQNVEAIIPKLQTIRGLGVDIAVDDFGTGYSSLSYVARLPIHALKIDRSFVIEMTESADSLAVVRSVISLAHSLRLTVIAEGVETEEQAALLRDLDCNEIQGYLVGKPMPPDALQAYVTARSAATTRTYGSTAAERSG